MCFYHQLSDRGTVILRFGKVSKVVSERGCPQRTKISLASKHTLAYSSFIHPCISTMYQLLVMPRDTKQTQLHPSL